MVGRDARAGLLAGRMVPEQPHRRFGDGPREGGMTELRAGRCCRARAEPARGDAGLPAWEPAESVDCLAPHAGQDLAASWDRAQAGAGLGLGRLGSPHAIPL